jgi:lipopolysaccharide export LptBFGC system permease protein LptF
MRNLKAIEQHTVGFIFHYRLYKYLLMEFVPYFIGGILVVLVFMGGNAVLFNMMEHIISKQVPPEVYLKVLLLQMPTFLVMGLPMAVMFGVLLAFGRLSQDNELDAMRTSRVVAWRMLLFMALVVGVPVYLLDAHLIQKTVPASAAKSLDLWKRYLVSDVAGQPASNVFFQGKEGTYFFIGRFHPDSGVLENVTVYSTGDGTEPYPRMMVAPRGQWRDNFAYLNDGRIYDVKEDGLLRFDSTFSSLKIDVEREIQEYFGSPGDPMRSGVVDPSDPGKIARARWQQSRSLETDMIFNLSMDKSVDRLKQDIKMYKASGVDTRALETNMHFKQTIPFSCIVVILLATPISIGGARARSGIMKSILLILVFLSGYYISTIITVALGHSGVLAPQVAAWAQNAAFSAVGLLLAVFYMRK